MKIFWFDVKTTGFEPKENGMIQISIFIANSAKQELSKGKDCFDSCIKPFSDDVIVEKALQINNIMQEQFFTYPEPVKVFKELTNFLNQYVNKFDRNDKLVPAGYNINFDIQFLRQFFIKNGDKYYDTYFTNHYIDVMQMVMLGKLKKPDFNPKNFRLKTIVEYLGIKNGDFHEAMNDVLMTSKVAIKLLE